MSHLWVKPDAAEWLDHALEVDRVRLTPDAPLPWTPSERLGAAADPVLVRTRDGHGRERWTLLCPPGSRVRVNGMLVAIGARMLADRDAIALGNGQTVFFSAEQVAEVVSFPAENNATSCIRCKLPLAGDTPAVRCPSPGCGFWHHHSEEQPCWTYTPGCANCGHPTAFDAGYQWTPEEL